MRRGEFAERSLIEVIARTSLPEPANRLAIRVPHFDKALWRWHDWGRPPAVLLQFVLRGDLPAFAVV